MEGHKKWLIPDCFWPAESSPGAYVSHEAICVLNTGNEDAQIHLTFYFEDREPLTAKCVCAARRTHHVRLDALKDGSGKTLLPRGVPYAAALTSDVPIIAQYSRCDSTHPSVTLMTSMAFPC